MTRRYSFGYILDDLIRHFDIVPDILIMAKSMASGLPLSATAARGEIMNRWKPDSHGNTYGGNALACAAGRATIRVLQEEKLVENSARLGKKLMNRLNSLKENYQGIGDLRGLGLMVGVEFVVPGGRNPDGKKAKAMQKSCLDIGLLLLTCGTDENVIRWIPPLIINDGHLEEALDIFEQALKLTANS